MSWSRRGSQSWTTITHTGPSSARPPGEASFSMPSFKLYIPILLAGLIITGSSNSLWTKYQDKQCVEDCDGPNPVVFEQPVFQTLQMFLGEMLCFIPVFYMWIKSKRQPIQLPVDEPVKDAETLHGWRVFLLAIPALCDLTGTTLMNIGLIFTPVSIYQMSRGSLVLFVGIFSVLFLHRRLWLYQWVSLLVVMGGIGLVGYAGSLLKNATVQQLLGLLDEEGNEDVEAGRVVIGIFFVLVAQLFTATQFVVEEKIMSRYSVGPLEAVGFEGLFGASGVLLAMPFFSIPAIKEMSPFFDLHRGWQQMINTPTVLYSSVAIACSIAFFNFFRPECDTSRVRHCALGLGWEKLLFPVSLLQVTGFSLLVYGTFLFNNLVTPPKFLRPPVDPVPEPAETEGLLNSIDDIATLPVDLGQSGYDVVPQTTAPKASSTSA
ncbi:hypothetical protein HMN09_00062300 [Mycena chlorophos]|uniref:Integral membrane protein n=1 Tax=Mycena chlorophos TaxID=658473 RepID=A0A8H6WLA6_MYCCL|nr:hypothetical protein HMN09_00062300 [Mycena chlorophos]